jgi:hypothetical protein
MERHCWFAVVDKPWAENPAQLAVPENPIVRATGQNASIF